MMRMATHNGRRSAAVWLLLVWAVFWLSATIQPYCRSATVDDARPWSAAPAKMVAGDLPCGSMSGDGELCQGVSAAKVDPSDLTGPLAYRLDSPSDVSVVSVARAPVPADARIAYIRTDSPSSGAPLYVRLQRLLI